MQFTKILGSLADVYGHIFLTPHGEVDMNDVVLNRRILVVMLPALEKSADEVANLGRIIVATLKGMMGSTLGNTLEDSWEKVVDARPYNSPSPFIVILDEVGYYCVNGMAIMAAQGRSLGFSLVFATQDIPAMLRENDKEAKSIIANTTTKIFMRVEELEQTAKLAIDSGGKGMKAQVGGFSGRAGHMHTHFVDGMEARFELVDRISSLDLRALGVGEAYVTWHDRYFKVKTFHAFPEGEHPDLGRMQVRVNHFLAVCRPAPSDLAHDARLPAVAERIADARFASIVSKRAAAELSNVARAAAEKRDPAKMKSEIACMSVAMLRANKKTGPGGDYLTASCAAIAAITLAHINDAEIFTTRVRQVEGLAGAAVGPSKATGRPLAWRGGSRESGGRSGFDVAAAYVAGARDDAFGTAGCNATSRARWSTYPPASDEFPPGDDLDFETEPDFEDPTSFTDAFARPDVPTDPDRIAAQRSDAPSTMRKVEHGVTVDGRDTFRMAETLQTNDATLRFLAALNFDAEENEPSVGAADTAIEMAVLGDAEDDTPAPTARADPAQIERADVASARATQWSDRVSREIPDLDEAIRSGNVADVTTSFLASLLIED